MQQAASLLAQFTDGRQFADYDRDAMLRAAVGREFEIIGEALGQLAKLLQLSRRSDVRGGRPGGVPTNATAVTGNLTVTGQTSLAYLYIGPNAMKDPTSSTLNFPVGDDRANGATVALGGGGTLSVTYVAVPGATAQVIYDVTGYFVP